MKLDIVYSTHLPLASRQYFFFCYGEQGHRQASYPKAGCQGLFTEDVLVYDEELEYSTIEIVKETLAGDSGMNFVIR